MTLLKSLFLGYPGNYQVYNIPVSIYRKGDEFDKMIDRLGKAIERMNAGNSPTTLDNKFLPTKPFTALASANSSATLLTQEYFFTFIHEMGHALAAKLLAKEERPNITIYLEERDSYPFQSKSAGETNYCEDLFSSRENNIILAAGPISECVVSGAQCLAVVAIARYLPSYVSKAMYAMAIAPFFGRTVNSMYCFGEKADFAKIRQNSYTALAIATALVAGNAFAVIALGRKIDSNISF